MIKLIFVFTIYLLVNYCFGQQVNFKNESVDSIVIQANISAYKFDKKGTTKGVSNQFLIVFDSIKSKYKIEKYSKEKYLMTYLPDTIEVNTISKKIVNPYSISYGLISKLTRELSNNSKSNDLIKQIDTAQLKKILTPKQIKKVAKLKKVKWNLKKRYSSKEENKLFFKECLSIESFNNFLIEEFTTTGYPVISDYSNSFIIQINTNANEYHFEGKYPNTIKQPWYTFNSSSNIFPTPILNFNINYILIKILPKDFLLIDSISNKELANQYIVWYFKRKELIF